MHVFFVVAVFLLMAEVTMAADFSTPEGALQALEHAYARRDLEAAAAAKDFLFEARAMLEASKAAGAVDEQLVEKTAEVLELAFRRRLQSNGFPDFGSATCSVIATRELRPGLVEMTEECVLLEGGKSRDVVHAAKGPHGWRIVILPSGRV